MNNPFQLLSKFSNPTTDIINMYIANKLVDPNKIKSIVLDVMCDTNRNIDTHMFYKLPHNNIDFTYNI